MRNAREARCGVVSIVAINPVVLPQRSVMLELQAAVPEVGFAQPKGQHRMLLINMGLGTGYRHEAFADDLAMSVGVVPVEWLQDDRRIGTEATEVQRLLAVPLPVYLEDDTDGTGSCAVCGKR